MNFFEYIKNFFNKKQTLLLNEGNNAIRYPKEDFMARNRVEQQSIHPILQEPSLNECFYEFMRQYQIQEKRNNGYKRNAYNAFIRMFSEYEEEADNNLKYQKKLNSWLSHHNGEYSSTFQLSHGKPLYFHIMGRDGIDEYKDRDMTKLYINCKRNNIAELSTEILKRTGKIAGNKFQMKFLYDENDTDANKYTRNDKIVVYAENYSIAKKMAESIHQIENEKPKLFSNEKKLPFIPKMYGNIGISNYKHSRYSVPTPIGYINGLTYNDYMSKVVYYSIILSFDKYFKNQMTNISMQNRAKNYIDTFFKMPQIQQNRMLNEFSNTFKNICKVENIYSKLPVQGNNEIEF